MDGKQWIQTDLRSFMYATRLTPLETVLLYNLHDLYNVYIRVYIPDDTMHVHICK